MPPKISRVSYYFDCSTYNKVEIQSKTLVIQTKEPEAPDNEMTITLGNEMVDVLEKCYDFIDDN